MSLRDEADIASRKLMVVLLVIAVALGAAFVIRRAEGRPVRIAGAFAQRQPDWKQFDNDHLVLGNPDAHDTVIAFLDYECSYCRTVSEAMLRMSRDGARSLRIVVRHLPSARSAHGVSAGRAAECAHAQGRFAAMHDVVFASQGRFHDTLWTSLGAAAGVPSQSAFAECISSDASRHARIAADANLAFRAGINAAPTLLVNGLRLSRNINRVSLETALKR